MSEDENLRNRPHPVFANPLQDRYFAHSHTRHAGWRWIVNLNLLPRTRPHRRYQVDCPIQLLALPEPLFGT